MLELIKKHIKLDESFDDDLVQCYIDAAIERAEQYTGIALKKRNVKEQIEVFKGKGTMAYEPNGSMLVHGIEYNGRVPSSAYTIIGKDIYFDRAFSCEVGTDCFSLYLDYTAGPSCNEDIPKGIFIGIARYVSFQYEHRGDADGSTSRGTAFFESGALAEWKPYKDLIC